MNKLSTYITLEAVRLDLNLSSLKRLFEEAGLALESAYGIPHDEAFTALNERERLGSTALGFGCAVPHARLTGLEEPAVVLLRTLEPLKVPSPDKTGAQLIADGITQQLEKRVMFRRAMKRAMQNAMRLGALGIKVQSSGRLNGADIARDEWYREGRVPLQTLRANIDYATSEAHTTYGVVGVKVWVYKGDNFGAEEPVEAPREDRRGRRGDRPGKPGARRPNGGRRNDMKQDRAPRKPAAKDGE